MLRGLLNQGNQNQPNEVVRDTPLHHKLNLLNQENSGHGNTGQGNRNRYDSLGQCELVPGPFFVSIFIMRLVALQHFVEDTSVADVVPDITRRM